jgi:hypothetical protein
MVRAVTPNSVALACCRSVRVRLPGSYPARGLLPGGACGGSPISTSTMCRSHRFASASTSSGRVSSSPTGSTAGSGCAGVDQSVVTFPCAGRPLLHRAQVKSSSRTMLRSPHLGQRLKTTLSVKSRGCRTPLRSSTSPTTGQESGSGQYPVGLLRDGSRTASCCSHQVAAVPVHQRLGEMAERGREASASRRLAFLITWTRCSRLDRDLPHRRGTACGGIAERCRGGGQA